MGSMQFDADHDNGVLTATREFSASAEKVWEAMTKPELFEQWWGPRGWSTTVKHMNVEPGGYVLYGMKCEDEAQGDWFGKESWGKSTYEIVDPPRELTYTDEFCDSDGKVDENMPGMKITVTFEPTEAGTRMISKTTFAKPEDLKTVMDMGMQEGFTQTWDRLEEFLAQ